jgi:cytochrome P450
MAGMQPLESYNLLDPETVENPFEYYTALRERAPVYKMPSGMWIVSTYALCLEAIRDYEAFSSQFIQKMSGGAAGRDGNILGPETLLSNDPPSHTYFRKLVNKAFSPARVKKLSASIRVIAEDLVAKLEGTGRFDAVSDYAVPLPLTVIADQLGVPRRNLAEFKRWSDATIVPIGGMATPEQLIESLKLTEELKSYLGERCKERMADRKDDMLSDLVHAEVDGERAAEIKEVVSILQQFLVAGNETTTNLIAATLQFLLQHPDQLALVQKDRGLLPNAVEEALRLETPTSGMWRVTTRDVELGGETIPEGSMVMLRYAAANRDEAVFKDAESFDVRRENAREHLAFGMGIHFCPGASLAREETRIGVELILDRMPGLRLAPGNDFSHHPNMLLRGLKRLDLEFDARVKG